MTQDNNTTETIERLTKIADAFRDSSNPLHFAFGFHLSKVAIALANPEEEDIIPCLNDDDFMVASLGAMKEKMQDFIKEYEE